MKKILICAVPFSDNLGDGVIATSLAHIVGLKYPDAKVVFLDIAGRHGFDEKNLRGAGAFGVFQRLPPQVRSAIVFAYCLKNYCLSWRKYWRAAISDADMVIIGGGQLFCDVALNFPTKLFLLGRLLHGKRVAVVSVGVTAKWSFWGKVLVGKFLKNAAPFKIATRDSEAAQNLHDFFQVPTTDIVIIPDPALVCASAFASVLSPDKKWDVGICVSSLDALVMNSEYSNASGSGSIDFFSNLAIALRKEGVRALYFTNGAAEDNKVLAEICSQVSGSDSSFFIPKRPEDLVMLISACSCIVAHRLHANIVAYSLNIPSVGMNWDKKVESFFQLTDRSQYLFDLAPRPDNLMSCLLNLLNKENSDRSRLEELKGEVISGTHALI